MQQFLSIFWALLVFFLFCFFVVVAVVCLFFLIHLPHVRWVIFVRWNSWSINITRGKVVFFLTRDIHRTSIFRKCNCLSMNSISFRSECFSKILLTEWTWLNNACCFEAASCFWCSTSFKMQSQKLQNADHTEVKFSPLGTNQVSNDSRLLFFTADVWRMHKKQYISRSKQRFRTSAWMKESYFPALWLFYQPTWAALDSYWLPAKKRTSQVGQSKEDQQSELFPALLAAGSEAHDAAQSCNFSVNCCKGKS